MGKTDPFKDRPKLPSREQIMADLNAAQDDDVVFREIDGSKSSCQTSSRDESETDDTTVPDKPTVDNNYSSVTKLIQLQARLKLEPQLLQENYEQLEKLGQNVSSSITELKSAAELVMKKS